MKRLIWLLENGQKKYSTKRGKPELWNDLDIFYLKMGIEKNGMPAYTEDLEIFAPIGNQLNELGFKNIIRVVSYELEDEKNNLNPNVIL